MDIWVAIAPDNAAKLAKVLTEIDGVDFAECHAARVTAEIDGQPVPLISREHLRKNKLAAARHTDLDDLENLPADDSKLEGQSLK